MLTKSTGVLNLLLTGWIIKKFGPRMAMAQQAFFPVVRLCAQNIGSMSHQAFSCYFLLTLTQLW